MGVTDPLAMPVARRALDGLMHELTLTAAGAPKHARITPGDVVVAALIPTAGGAIDECCEGIASVRVTRVFPTEEFPNEDPRAHTEGGPISWGVALELQVVRCGSQPGQDMAPTDDQLTADAARGQDDAAAMRRVGAWLEDQGYVVDYLVGAWEPTAAEGGCLGGILTLTVQVGCTDC